MEKQNKITLYFKGISNNSIWCNIALINPNIIVELSYWYGLSVITFLKNDKKTIGKAISKSFKSKKFQVVRHPDYEKN